MAPQSAKEMIDYFTLQGSKAWRPEWKRLVEIDLDLLRENVVEIASAGLQWLNLIFL